MKGNNRVSEVNCLYSLMNCPCNTLSWSPMGNYILLAGLGTALRGSLEFYDVSNQLSLNKVDHFSCTNITWSPNGHYCVTSSCYSIKNKQDFENGYNIWDNRGEKLFSDRFTKFISFQFRPWPLNDLSDEKKKEIRKNLNSYADTYREQHEKAELLKHIGDIRKTLKAIADYRERREKMMKQAEEINEERVKLFGEEKDEMVEVSRWIEGEVIEVKEEVC